MSEKLTQQYDSLYASTPEAFGNGEPVSMVTRIREYVDGGSILDIGGGQGRNALYLAQQGFDVTVMDLSSVGLSQLAYKAKKQSVSIATIVGDVTKTVIHGQFNGVVLSFLLHHLASEDAIRVLTTTKDRTLAGGVHIITTFTSQGALADRNRMTGRYYPTGNDLLGLYSGWSVQAITVQETTTYARDKQGERMRNEMIAVLLQKPVMSLGD